MSILKSDLLPLLISGLSLLLSIIALIAASKKRKVIRTDHYVDHNLEFRFRELEASIKRSQSGESNNMRLNSQISSEGQPETIASSTENSPAPMQTHDQEAKQELAPTPEPKPYISKKYSPIPEDNRIKAFEIQTTGEGDSFIEIDFPSDTRIDRVTYRFNVKTNQQYVISQGIDRLENAFAFTKPTSQRVNQILASSDGILVKEANFWKIEDKAKIEFK